ATDRDRTQAFYGAHGALEQLTTYLCNLFVSNFAPTGAEVRALAATAPSISGVNFTNPAGGSGYTIEFAADAKDKPIAEKRTITSGPYEGFIGLMTPY